MMFQETQYETPHIPATLRGDTIWETKLDQGNKYKVLPPHKHLTDRQVISGKNTLPYLHKQ